MRYFEFINSIHPDKPCMTPSEACLMADLMLLSTAPLNRPFKQLLSDIKTLTRHSRSPTCFISYAWVGPNMYPEQLWTQEFIYRLESWLKLAGIEITIDKNDSRFGNRLPEFMEESVKNNDFVILMGTKALKAKLSSEQFYNVKKEYEFIQIRIENEKANNNPQIKSVIPLIISGKGKEALPDELFGQIAIEDFSGNDLNPGQINVLVSHLELLIAKLHSINTEHPLMQNHRSLWARFKKEYVFCRGNHAGNLSAETQPPFLYFQQAHARQCFFGKTKYPSSYNLPQNNGKMYVGRQKELRIILEQLNGQPKDGTFISVISGMGGVGKTTLTKQIIFQLSQQTTNRFIIWLRVNDQIDNTLYSEIIKRLGLNIGTDDSSQQQRWLFDWFRDHPGWILVLDNVTDQEQIKPYLPPYGGHIIITSRSKAWNIEHSFQQIDLPKLSPEESYQLLRETLQDDAEEDLKLLAKTLDHLPLAIIQAKAYIYNNKDFLSVRDYLRLLEEKPTQISQHYKENKSVWLTLNISLDLIRETRGAAIKLLNFCSLFSGRDIPRDFLTELAGIQFKQFMTGLSPIFSYCLASANKQNDMISLHPAVSAIVFDALVIEEKKLLIERGLVAIKIALSVEKKSSGLEIILVGFFLELSVKANIIENTPCKIDEILFAETLLIVLPILFNQDNMQALKQLSPRCEKILENQLIPKNGTLYLTLLDNLVKLSIKTRDRFSTLASKYNELDSLSIPPHFAIQVKLNRARIAFELKQYDSAAQYLNSLLKDHLLSDKDRVSTLTMLSATYATQDRDLSEVNAIAEQTYAAIHKQMPSDDAVITLTYVTGNIGEYYVRRGKWQEAKELRLKNISYLEKVTKQSTDRGLSWNYWSLANIESKFGDLELAKYYYQQFVEKMNRVFSDFTKWPLPYLECKDRVLEQINRRELSEQPALNSKY